jgi:hypothetical protein
MVAQRHVLRRWQFVLDRQVTPAASATTYLPPHGRRAAGEGDLHHDGGSVPDVPNGPIHVFRVPCEKWPRWPQDWVDVPLVRF